MLAELGIVTTGLALICAAIAALFGAYGALNHRDRWIVSARNGLLFTMPLLSIACLSLVIAQLTGRFEIQYVWSVTQVNEPTFFKITALWGAQPGSLLFWSWMLSAFVAVAILLNWRSERRLMPWMVTFSAAVLTFFMILVVLYENPFARFWLLPGAAQPVASVFQPAPEATLFFPRDGQGLNPLLRHFGMVIHPPMLYGGYVGMTIPFAFAMAALASGQLNTNWIRATRRWTLVAWLFLSAGLILGGRWAYDVLGWGGYWGWDPVENVALLPWLTGTAFLHSIMIQERRGMLKTWNMFLIIFTFLLVILGTFSTRSGIVASVHSFARSQIGMPMLIFLGICTVGCLGLWAWRWSRGELASDHRLEGLLSRESMFILNNWLFMGAALMVLWGTYAPLFTELLSGQAITLGAEYYNAVVIPIFGAIYVLMGVAPLVAWKRASLSALGKAIRVPLALTLGTVLLLIALGTHEPGAFLSYGMIFFAGYTVLWEYYRGVQARTARGESVLVALNRLFARNRSRYGGYFIHLAVVVIGIGVVASTVYQQETQQTLEVGQSITLGNMTMRYDEAFEAVADDGRTMVVANVSVFRDGQYVGQIRPRKDFFGERGMPMSIAGQYTTLESDFYVLLTNHQGDRITFKVYLNPLVNLIWWGGVLLIVGTLLAAYPDPRRELAEKVAEARAPGSLQIAGD
jgi:cytochrome c-type biogenesis protein CcmF